jgi:transposase-like protein
MGRSIIRYSEAFKRKVVSELESGKLGSISEAKRLYEVRGGSTIQQWIRKYGSDELLPKKVKIETLKERDELKAARKRIRQLEAALADAHIDSSLGDSYLKIACERLGIDVSVFKKKNAITLSELRKRQSDLK